MTAPTDQEIAELRRLAEAATKGEWLAEPWGDIDRVVITRAADHRVLAEMISSPHKLEDAALIVAMHDILPRLLDAYEARREEIERARREKAEALEELRNALEILGKVQDSVVPNRLRIVEVEAERDEAERERDEARTALEAEKRLGCGVTLIYERDRLSAQLAEAQQTWFDPETEVTWRPATAWAYAAACKALHKHEDEAKRLTVQVEEMHSRLDDLLCSYPAAIAEWADGVRKALSTPSRAPEI